MSANKTNLTIRWIVIYPLDSVTLPYEQPRLLDMSFFFHTVTLPVLDDFHVKHVVKQIMKIKMHVVLLLLICYSSSVCSMKQRSSDQEKLSRGVNDASGTLTLSTGLGDNINLNFMTGLSDDEEGQVNNIE